MSSYRSQGYPLKNGPWQGSQCTALSCTTTRQPSHNRTYSLSLKCLDAQLSSMTSTSLTETHKTKATSTDSSKLVEFLLMGPVCTLWQFRTPSNNPVAQQLKCTRVECDSNQVELKKPHKTAWKVNLDSPICQHLSQTSPLHDSSGGSYHPQRDRTIYQEHGLASYLWCTPQHTCKQKCLP